MERGLDAKSELIFAMESDCGMGIFDNNVRRLDAWRVGDVSGREGFDSLALPFSVHSAVYLLKTNSGIDEDERHLCFLSCHELD